MTHIFVKGDTFVLLDDLVRVDVACCGECCGGVWRTSVGECCAGEWIKEDGTVQGREGTWVCCSDSNGVVSFDVLAAADPGCDAPPLTRCCTDGNCTEVPADECTGEVLSGSCANFGCPKSCCSENQDGVVSCETVDEMLCVSPRVVDEEPCESACKGACCVDGELVEGSPKTQSECEELGGAFQGIGTTSCVECDCREPFDCDCCEEVESKGAGLTFYQPRRKRKSPWSEGTFRVTATVTTASPVLVHGVLVEPNSNCNPTNVEFLLCWESFNVEPVPCGSNFSQLKIKVCWEDQAVTAESLTFSGCNNITIPLGFCGDSCVTTMTYVGAGHTSNAVIQLRGDAVIDASGTGPLVLTGNVSLQATCDPASTLTLAGTNTANNTIQGVIGGTDLDVEKTGTGTWLLSANNSYSGQLRVLEGTLVVAGNVNASGNSPFGSNNSESVLPIIGSSAAGLAGTAALFIEGSREISRGMSIAALGAGSSQVAVLGMTGNGDALFGGGHDITLGRGVTLQASNGSTVTFANNWVNASDPVAFTIGSDGNAGVVILEGELPIATAVNIVTGTVRLQIFSDDRINPATPVTVETATFDTNGQSQSLDSMTVNGELTIEGAGSLTVTDLAGAGDVVQAAGTFTINGANTLTGTLTVNGGTTVVNQIVSGPALVTSATLTSSTLTVAFSGTPASGNQFVLLAGPTGGSYSPVLTGAGGATGTYNSANSTLTIT